MQDHIQLFQRKSEGFAHWDFQGITLKLKNVKFWHLLQHTHTGYSNKFWYYFQKHTQKTCIPVSTSLAGQMTSILSLLTLKELHIHHHFHSFRNKNNEKREETTNRGFYWHFTGNYIIPEARYIEKQILLQYPFLIQLLHNLKEVRKMMKLRKNEVQEKESNTVGLRLLTT